MATPFSRTLRVMQADNYTINIAALALALVLGLIWVAWLFGARVSVYEDGQLRGTNSQGYVVSTFPRSTLGKLQLGQRAIVTQAQPPGSATPTQRLSATVYDINDSRGQQVEVTLVIDRDNPWADSTVLQGTVQIETDTVSPASMILNASRQNVGSDTSHLTPP